MCLSFLRKQVYLHTKLLYLHVIQIKILGPENAFSKIFWNFSYILLNLRMGEMTSSVTLLQTFNTFSDDVSDLFYILLLGLTWFKVD